jgi:hypothetical protein
LDKIESNQRKKFLSNIVKNRDSEKLKSKQKHANKSGEFGFGNMVKKIAESLHFDETLNVPFGMGFDEYIWKTKEQKLKAGEAQFLNSMQKILNNLNLRNEQELVKLYEHVISEAQVADFRDAARNFILEKILRELMAHKRTKKPIGDVLEKYLDPSSSNIEYVISNFQDIGI